MGSITSMSIAVQLCHDKYKVISSREVLKIRINNPLLFDEIKGKFRCYGCFKKTPNGPLPSVTHVYKENSGGSHHFRIYPEQNHIPGCIYNEPEAIMKELGDRHGLQIADQKEGIYYLPKLDAHSQAYETFSHSSPTTGHTQNTNHIHKCYLQDLYDLYREDWIERKVHTGQKIVTIGQLLITPDLANQKIGEHCIIQGKVWFVTDRKESKGYINVRFFRYKGQDFSLYVKPGHIYETSDLKQIEGRKIACYGKVEKNKSYLQMELLDVHKQIVFLDSDKEAPIFYPPKVSLERVWTSIEQAFSKWNVEQIQPSIDDFNYYHEHQVPVLKDQLEDKRNQKANLIINGMKQKEQQVKKMLADRTSLESELTQIDQTEQHLKKEIQSLTHQIKSKNGLLSRFFAKKDIKRWEDQLCESQINLTKLQQDREDIEQKIIHLKASVDQLNEQIKRAQLMQDQLDKEILQLYQQIASIQKGLEIEAMWKKTLLEDKPDRKFFLLSSNPHNWIIAITAHQSKQNENQIELHWRSFACSNNQMNQLLLIKPYDAHKVVSPKNLKPYDEVYWAIYGFIKKIKEPSEVKK